MGAVGICGTIAATVSKVATIVGFCLVTLLVLSDTAVSAQTRKGPTRAIVSQLSLWIVPNGAPLPNPNEDEEEEP